MFINHQLLVKQLWKVYIFCGKVAHSSLLGCCCIYIYNRISEAWKCFQPEKLNRHYLQIKCFPFCFITKGLIMWIKFWLFFFIYNSVGLKPNIANFKLLQTWHVELQTHSNPGLSSKTELRTHSNSFKKPKLWTCLAQVRLPKPNYEPTWKPPRFPNL